MFKKLFLLLVFSFTLISCTSVPKDSAYYKENIKDFSQIKLQNGIPVILKNVPTSKITVIQMIIEGGTPLLSTDKSGLENVTLELMLHGCDLYSYEEIKKLEYEISYSLTMSSSKDYSVVRLKCIDKDFDTVFSLFADSVLNPLMQKEDFEQIMNEKKESVQQVLSNPSSLLGREVHKIAYKNHNYAALVSVTEGSINSISYKDVIECYNKILNSNRIKFVVVGNFNTDRTEILKNRLDEYFGNIKTEDFNVPIINKVSVKNEVVNITSEQAGDVGYLIGFFNCPNRYDLDYVPYAIATMYLDDILFSYVRENKGAVYSIGSGILGGKEMLGAISAFKVSDKENIIKLINESIEMFPNQKEIETKLDQYKNKYITTLFSSSQNITGVASNIVISLEYANNPTKYLERTKEVQNVTAKQVLEAYKKYLSRENDKNPITWVFCKKDKN